MSDKHEPPTSRADTLYLIIEAVVAVVLTYYFWQPLYDFISPIVDATLGSALTALGL